jgi:hypothetical protein
MLITLMGYLLWIVVLVGLTALSFRLLQGQKRSPARIAVRRQEYRR